MAVTKDTVVIVEADTLSTQARMAPNSLVAIQVPEGMASTTISFQGCHNGIDFYPIKDSTGQLITVTIDNTAAIYVLSPCDFAGLTNIKVQVDSPESGDFVLTLLSVRTAN